MKAFTTQFPQWSWYHRLLCKIGLEKFANWLPHNGISYIKSDPHDYWSADYAISKLALPILKDLRKHKTMGVPGCMLDDPNDDSEEAMKVARAKWDLILDKIIWAHEQVVDEETDAFYTVKGSDWKFVPVPDNPQLFSVEYDIEPVINWDARHAYHERIQEGLDLFGKYYRNLWD